MRDAPWRKLGGECCDDNDAFARVYNNLLLHEYIYYSVIDLLLIYTSALLTFCLPFFLHCVSKTFPMFLAITRESIVGFS